MIIGQRKAFYRQRIPESSCARKETVDIDILEPVMKNIYQSNTYRKDLSGHISLMSKGFKRTAKEGPKVLYICFYSLPNNSKQ